MPHNKKNLSPARTQNKPSIKPPADLWERLDAAVKHLDPPDDAFTANQTAIRYGISVNKAVPLLAKLVNAGKLHVVGVWDERKYYQWVK